MADIIEKFQTAEELFQILAGVENRGNIYLYSKDGGEQFNTIRFHEGKLTDGSTVTDAFLFSRKGTGY